MITRTDGHQGGCMQSWGIAAPPGLLDGFNVFVDIQGMPGADASQCFGRGASLGKRQIPVTVMSGGLKTSAPIFIDTDNRLGGCAETWSVEGTNKSFALELLLNPENGGDKTTCNPVTGNTPIRLMVGQSVTLNLDMDFQKGCAQQWRIVALQ